MTRTRTNTSMRSWRLTDWHRILRGMRSLLKIYKLCLLAPHKTLMKGDLDLQTRSRNIILPSSGAFNLKPYQRPLSLPLNLHTIILKQTIDKKQTSKLQNFRQGPSSPDPSSFEHASSYRMFTYTQPYLLRSPSPDVSTVNFRGQGVDLMFVDETI